METQDKELCGLMLIKKAMDLGSFSWEARLRMLRWSVNRFLGSQYQITKTD